MKKNCNFLLLKVAKHVVFLSHYNLRNKKQPEVTQKGFGAVDTWNLFSNPAVHAPTFSSSGGE